MILGYLGSLTAALAGWSTIMYVLYGRLKWWQNTFVFCLTFAARRLPGSIWYVGGRLAMYQQLGVPESVVLIASSVELIVSIITGLLIGLCLLSLSGVYLPYQGVVIIIIGIIVGALVLHPSILKFILKRNNHLSLQTIKYKNILIWFLIYIVMWGLGGLMLDQLISVFTTIGANEHIIVIGTWAISGAAGLITFFLPSSFGVTELTITALLSRILPLPFAGVIAILMRIFTTLCELLISLAFFPLLKNFQANSDHSKVT